MTTVRLRAAGWTVALGASTAGLVALGRGALAAPPLGDVAALGAWLDERGAVAATFALVRLVALGAAGYLATVTALGLLSRATRVPALDRLSRAVTLPAVQHVLGTVAGLGLTASTAALLADGAGARSAGPAPALALTRLPDGDVAEDVVLERLADGTDADRAPDDPDPDPDTAPGFAVGPSAPAEWVVAPGDHLWHIAEVTLAERWGRAVTDEEVVPYWQQVITLNRSRLVDPDDPDLIHPGQVLDLPPPVVQPSWGRQS